MSEFEPSLSKSTARDAMSISKAVLKPALLDLADRLSHIAPPDFDPKRMAIMLNLLSAIDIAYEVFGDDTDEIVAYLKHWVKNARRV